MATGKCTFELELFTLVVVPIAVYSDLAWSWDRGCVELILFPVDMRIPPLKIDIILESDPLKSRILVRRLAAVPSPFTPGSATASKS